MRAAAPLLLLALLLAAPRPARGASPEEALAAAQRAYARGVYGQVIALIRPLLYPRIRLPREEQVLVAYKLLAVSYVLEKQPDAARREFGAILALRPDFRLDPLVDPVAAVDLLDAVKRQMADKLRRIRERQRQEAARRQEARAARKRGREVIVREVERNRFWINFVPFGAGQLQNGQRTKAFVLMGTQAALGALSLGMFIGLRASGVPLPASAPQAERDRVRAMAVVQVASGAAFFAAVAYGVIDAIIYYRPVRVRETRKRVTLWPVAGPGGAAGLGLGLTF